MSTSLSTPAGFSANNLVFNDNFLGTTLNASFWNTYMTSASTQGGPWDSSGQGGSGVSRINDVDYFEPSQDAVNSGLTITAAQKSVVGNNYTNGQLVSQTFPITSGVVAAGNNANLSLSGLSQTGPITNVSGTATIDAGSTLNLQGTTLTVGALDNNGTVDSTGVSALDGGALTNSSLLEATSGVLTVGSSSLTNSGNLLAAGGTLDVTGGGTATISGKNSVLEFGAASAETTTFSSSATAGILKLDNASSFSGTVVGLAMDDGIDLANFLFSSNPNGSLSVTLALLNQHASQFGLNPAAYSLVSDSIPRIMARCF
jgi:hypothetical protein